MVTSSDDDRDVEIAVAAARIEFRKTVLSVGGAVTDLTAERLVDAMIKMLFKTDSQWAFLLILEDADSG